MFIFARVFILSLCIILNSAFVFAETQYLTHQDLAELPRIQADVRISYGPDSLQFGDLRIPGTPGPHPVVIIIHGGCWLSMVNLQIMDRFAEALTNEGFVTWNIEYRRIDNPGGGWPGTFKDIGLGIDHIRSLASEYHLDLHRLVLIGHSSGGHLALWAAARHRLPPESELYVENPLRSIGVVCLAGPTDLVSIIDRDQEVCGRNVTQELLGGTPEEVPDRFREASPIAMLPLGVRQTVIYGSDDPAVLPSDGYPYVASGKERGENIGFIIIPDAAHFELIAPWTPSWPIVKAAVISTLAAKTQTINRN